LNTDDEPAVGCSDPVELNYVADVSEGHHAPITMKIEAACSSETLVTIHQTIWPHISENGNIQQEGGIKERGITGGVEGEDKCRKMREKKKEVEERKIRNGRQNKYERRMKVREKV
jgi:hypothetical protein